MSDFGLGLSAFGILAASAGIWFRKIQRVEIPENRVYFILTWVFAALLGGVALLGEPGWMGGSAATLGLVGSLFFLGTVAIGKQTVDAHALSVGATIPEFTATDEHGEIWSSASLAGHPVLIKFFRGHW